MPPESSLRRAARALISEIQDRVLDLCSLDFPTSSPASLGETYAKMARSIEKGIETTTDERVIQFCVAYLKRVASHLRFIEGASAERIPWALTSPFERLLQKLAPGVLAMVRSRWSYNYTIAELYDSYRTAMKSFLPRTTLTDCFGDDNAKFYLISVPVIERRNVLLHLVLGHEVGHRETTSLSESESSLSRHGGHKPAHLVRSR